MRWYGYYTHSELIKGYFHAPDFGDFIEWDQYLFFPYKNNQSSQNDTT